MSNNACLICGSAEREAILTFTEPDQYERAVGVTGEGYFRSWERCVSCGFHYSCYSRDPKILDRLYADEYRNGNAPWRSGNVEEIFDKIVALPSEDSETVVRVDWVKQKMEAAAASGASLPSYRPLRLLDVGGASGVFAFQFQDDKWRSEVIDPGRAGYFLEKKHDITYHACLFGDKSPGGGYDLLSLVYTLEHLRDPLKVLTLAREELTKTGFLFIEVPDALAFSLKESDDDIFNACHLWMFDPVSITRLVARAGFEIYSLERTRTRRGHLALTLLGGVA